MGRLVCKVPPPLKPLKATKYKVQVYVSLDLTSSLITSSQNRDPNFDVVMLELEKRLVQFMGGVL